MILNLAAGTTIIALTVVVQTFGLILLSRLIPWFIRWLRLHRHNAGKAGALVVIVLGLFAVHTVEIWLWAIFYSASGAIGTIPDALYFSTGAFSTSGSGETLVDPHWRLTASLESIDGFILIGWSIAYLVAASTRYGPFRPGEHF